MTAPVTEMRNESEKIAMTAPVYANLDGELHAIAFVMPKTYKLDSLPIPKDSRVKLVKIPEKKMAVLRFSWISSGKRVKRLKNKLLLILASDEIKVTGTPSYAGYNAPWSPPWMARHEILVEIK